MESGYWKMFLLTWILSFAAVAAMREPIGPLKCRLKWVETRTDDQIPSKAIASQMNMHFVVRPINGGGIGRMQVNNGTIGIGYVPGSPNVTEVQVFETLQNIYDCKTEWVLKSDDRIGDFKVEEGGKLVGRVMDASSNTLLPGAITGSQISYVDLNKAVAMSSDYYVLISYSKGLTLLLTDFDLKDDNSEGLDFLGIDEIRNEAEVEVTQTVTHSKSVTESFTISEHGSETISWSVAVNVDVSLGVKGVGASVGAGVEFSMTSESGWETEMTTTRSRDIEVSRTIAVPPQTSVQACSTIKSKENFTMEYTCLGRYKAAGMTGAEVVEILKLEGIDWQIYEEKEFAVAELQGSFTGSMSLSTQFIVTPIDALYGCSEMETSISDNKAKQQKLRRKEYLSNLSK